MKPEEGGDEWRLLPSGLDIRSLHKMGKDSESSNHFALAGRREQLFITQIAGAWNLSTYKIPVFKKLLEHLPSHLKRTLFKYAGYRNCMLGSRCICTILYTVTGIPLTAFGNASYCLFQCCAFPDCCIGVLQPCCDQTWLFPILCHIQLINSWCKVLCPTMPWLWQGHFCCKSCRKCLRSFVSEHHCWICLQ